MNGFWTAACSILLLTTVAGWLAAAISDHHVRKNQAEAWETENALLKEWTEDIEDMEKVVRYLLDRIGPDSKQYYIKVAHAAFEPTIWLTKVTQGIAARPIKTIDLKQLRDDIELIQKPHDAAWARHRLNEPRDED